MPAVHENSLCGALVDKKVSRAFEGRVVHGSDMRGKWARNRKRPVQRVPDEARARYAIECVYRTETAD